MEDCLFCKIISGEVPSVKVFEDNKVLAFLDLAPINPGHTLVVPKKHFEDLLSAEEDYLIAISKVIPKIAKAILKAGNYSGFNIGVNNGKVAGQVIPHLHFHIMPRLENDGHELFKGQNSTQEELELIAEKIINHI